MATASPPSPSAAPPPPPGPASPQVRSPRPGIVRILAVSALGAVVLIVAYLLFAGGGGASYQLIFKEGDQLVRGDQVQVGGVPVGSVTNIELTSNFEARVTIHVDSSLTPLHQGTTAQVRVPSLSSVANRYIALSPGPNNRPALAAGATLPSSVTGEVTDLDQLFNTLNPKTLKGLQQFIQGSAEQYVGASRAVGLTAEYTPPALTATDHFFSELVRDQSTFTKFLVETAKAVTTIGARKEALTDLIGNADKTFEAIGSQQSALARGLRQLPITLRQGNRTFAELPATFAALETLVKAQRPTTKPLTTLLERLRPLLTTATPAVRDFALTFNRPGANNDLTDFARALPGLVRALTTASPASVTALQESVPITAFFGPYSPDLEGTLRTFGEAGSYYDATGHYARVTPLFPDFALGAKNNLTPVSSQQALANLKTGQLRRCPGAATQPAADGSSPFVDGELLSCDPTETP
ncbi:MAG TPA: MlaD family protein [Solirubrobacteraceae bacterium]|nr:MlaD family protein [Solirubrobacteraceae bacterium]